MIAYDIKFTNRAKLDAREPTKNRAEFLAFAALCASRKLERFIESVMYDGNICAFEIELKELDDPDDFFSVVAPAGIDWCASQTLTQYVIDGTCGHKDSGEAAA